MIHLDADNLDPALEAPSPFSIFLGVTPFLILLLLIIIILLIKQIRKRKK